MTGISVVMIGCTYMRCNAMHVAPHPGLSYSRTRLSTTREGGRGRGLAPRRPRRAAARAGGGSLLSAPYFTLALLASCC
jgi:hypothetical protein